jgi:hypothetical protein
MGKLKPGATYIYENADGIVYAREFGADPKTRFEIGRTQQKQTLHEQLKESKLWSDIHREAKSNPALQDALDRVKIIYELSKDNGQK